MVTSPRARNAYQARSRLDKRGPQPPRRLDNGREAQTHDVRVAALDARHQRRPQALDRVPAGLVRALARRHVPRDLAVGDAPEADPRAYDHVLAAAGVAQRVAGVHVVDTAREPAQERGVLLRGRRLVDDLAVDHDRRVGGQHQVARPPRAHHRRLRRGQARHQRLGRLARQHGLVDVGRLQVELQAEAGEELAPTWRCAGQHETPHGAQSTQAGAAVRLPAEMAATPDSEGMKRAAAEAALALVEDGMTLGLGTGSTARWCVARSDLQAEAGEELAPTWRCAGQHETPHGAQSTQAGAAVRLPAEMAATPDSEGMKRAAAEAALALVEDGMTLGLGTGSTARWFVA